MSKRCARGECEKRELEATIQVMRAALQEVIAWADDCGWDSTGEPKAFETARAMIAKVEGRS